MSDRPRDTGIECYTCGALVAAFENAMCCHCRTVEWVFPETAIEAVQSISCKRVEVLEEALRPFAEGCVDVSATAVIVGYPECREAHRRARAALNNGERA